jgi:hypothetical protein
LTCSLYFHENHICKFCAKNLTYVGFISKNDKYYSCFDCNVQYQYADGFRECTKLYTKINDRVYVASIDFSGLTVYYFDTDQVTVSDMETRVKHHFKSFKPEVMPDITPENVNRKLKTILVFS